MSKAIMETLDINDPVLIRKHTRLRLYEEAIEDQKRYILGLEQEQRSGELDNREDIKNERRHLIDLYKARKILRGH